MLRSRDMLRQLKAKCLTNLIKKHSIHSRVVTKEIWAIMPMLVIVLGTLQGKIPIENRIKVSKEVLQEEEIWNKPHLKMKSAVKEQWVKMASNNLKVTRLEAELDLTMKPNHQMLDTLMKTLPLMVSNRNKNKFFVNLLEFKDNNKNKTRSTFHYLSNNPWPFRINKKAKVFYTIKLIHRSMDIPFRLIVQDVLLLELETTVKMKVKLTKLDNHLISWKTKESI